MIVQDDLCDKARIHAETLGVKYRLPASRELMLMMTDEIERLRAELAAAGDGDTWQAACKRAEKELAERTRERDAAREAARNLWFGYISRGITYVRNELLKRWPWLETK